MNMMLIKRLGVCITSLALLAPAAAQAATVDLATSPMVTGLTRTVKPNVMFILDDSGSMAYEYMPDGAS